MSEPNLGAELSRFMARCREERAAFVVYRDCREGDGSLELALTQVEWDRHVTSEGSEDGGPSDLKDLLVVAAEVLEERSTSQAEDLSRAADLLAALLAKCERGGLFVSVSGQFPPLEAPAFRAVVRRQDGSGLVSRAGGTLTEVLVAALRLVRREAPDVVSPGPRSRLAAIAED